MSGYVKKLPAGATTEQKLAMLLDSVEQLSKRLTESEQEITALKKLVDPEIPTRRLFRLIQEVNGHTSVMPDMKGYNSDHDRRYVRIGESALTEFTYYGDRGKRLWRIGIENGYLVTRFDKNLGVGTPDWSGDAYTSYPPNFD